jgi:RimJ/RimL family protein N-acetyltransferase
MVLQGSIDMTKTPSLPRPAPDAATLRGRIVDLERLDPARHGADLWHSIGSTPSLWQAVPPGPFADEAAFLAWLDERTKRNDQALYAIIDKSAEPARAAGLYFLINIDTAMARLEMGLVYGPALTRRTAGTEAFLLLGRYLFETLENRRLEWRCNPDNEASMRAATRFGFTLEGVLRQNAWIKGRNWDTAVYALLDREWQAQAARLAAWLAPGNFSGDGSQIKPLSAFN